jgi:predicted Rossmann fold nucleotide-binding protein DprA/Smf involved in DNA uptake
MTQQHSLIILHSIGFTHRDLKKIFETHENSDHILDEVRSGKWEDFPWILEDRKEKIKTRLRELDEDLLIRTITSKNINIITLKDESYPKKLRAIKQAPYLLYIR